MFEVSRAELKEQQDASVRCKMTERKLRRVQDANRELNNALFRKQKIITSLKSKPKSIIFDVIGSGGIAVLTNLRSEAKQHGSCDSTPGTGVVPHLNTKVGIEEVPCTNQSCLDLY